VHRLAADRIYVSHFPTFGLVVSGPDGAGGAVVPLEASYQAPGDPGKHVALVEGLAAAEAAWRSGGHPAWTALSDAQASQAWDRANSRPDSDPALQVFRAAGLPAITVPAPTVARLKRVAADLMATIRLAPAQAQAILSGSPAAVDDLRQLVATLSDQHLSSALPLVSGTNQVILVVAVLGLPDAGLNLSPTRAAGFLWYTVPIQGPAGHLSAPTGSRVQLTPVGDGLSAVVVLGYARRGGTDPFEYRVDLPTGAVLDLSQYELVMNILERSFPLGVQVNTFGIRKGHVDLNGDDVPESLDPNAARTYRPFKRSRLRDETRITVLPA
jgi:hypothetical protein